MILILVMVSVLFCLAWLFEKIAFMAVISYMVKKNLPMPSKENIEKETRFVIKRMIQDFLSWFRN